MQVPGQPQRRDDFWAAIDEKDPAKKKPGEPGPSQEKTRRAAACRTSPSVTAPAGSHVEGAPPRLSFSPKLGKKAGDVMSTRLNVADTVVTDIVTLLTAQKATLVGPPETGWVR